MSTLKAQGSLTGWLTTKKRGRDDSQIASDRQSALAARKKTTNKTNRSRSSNKQGNTANGTSSKVRKTASTGSRVKGGPSKKSNKRPRRQGIKDDDYEDDEEDVIIDDDSMTDDSMDQFVVHDSSSGADDDEDGSDSDNSSTASGVGTFFPTHKARVSQPSQALQRAVAATKIRRANPLALQVPATKAATTTTSKTSKGGVPPRTSTHVSKPGHDKNKNTLKESSPLSVEDLASSSSLPSNHPSSRFFTKKVTPVYTSDDDSSSLLLLQSPSARSSITNNKNSNDNNNIKKKVSLVKKGITNHSSLLEDTPEPPIPKYKKMATTKTTSKRMKNRFANFENPSYLKSTTSPTTTTTSTTNKHPKNHRSMLELGKDDWTSDEDERIALRAAIKASLKEQATTSTTTGSKHQPSKNVNSRKTKKISKVDKNPRQRPVQLESDIDDEDEEEPLATEELLKDSSDEDGDNNDEDDDDDDEQNDAYNEEQKVATSILKTAETLSAKVLSAMQEWSQSQSQHTGNPPAMTTGMIVDGALSIGDIMNSQETSTSSHKWISQQVMKEACPGVTLSNYQLIGVNWLALLYGMNCQIDGKDTPVNGILADEMGLGKTVQTIAFLAWLKAQLCPDNQYHAPHLIVVPVSVLPNWIREFETFCPTMNVYKYHGSQAEREVLQQELRQYLPENRSSSSSEKKVLDAIIVPVTYYQKETSDDRKFLNKFRFNYMVVDEAHMLKNALSTRYRMLDRVKTQHRLLLTGTPVQNSPQELLNMLCFIMPLFSKGSESIEDGSENNHNSSIGERMLQHFVDVEMEQIGDEQVAYKKLKQLFAPFVLRRKKEDVISQLLPPKQRLVEFVELDGTGRAIYNSILEAHVQKNGSKLTASIGEHLFTNLRKAAHHPLLLRTRHHSKEEIEHLTTCFHKYGAFKGDGSTKARVTAEVAKLNDFEIHLMALELLEENRHRQQDLQRYILEEDALFASPKFVRLQSLLPTLIQEGHRVLIFSGWTSCLDLLGCLMEHLGLQYLRMDGSCASETRQQMIDDFNQNHSIQVFLLSTRACGLGINLTSADTCIMHDLDFNPFNDLQAEDRCHRIGQTRKVTIYKLVTKDTVDADIYEMQERKAKMNAAIMESNDNSKKERKIMLEALVNRFLTGPTNSINHNNKETAAVEIHEGKETCVL